MDTTIETVSQVSDNGSSNPDSADFTRRLQDLPPELFNNIVDLTLYTLDPRPRFITIDHTWRPPTTIQVNSESRRAGAKHYYGKNVFDVDCHGKSLKACIAWLRFVPRPHKGYLTQIRLHNLHSSEPRPVDCSVLWRALTTGAAEGDLSQIVRRMCEREPALLRRSFEYFGIKDHLAWDQEIHRSLQWCTDKSTPVLHTKLRYTTGEDGLVHEMWWPVEPACADEVLAAFQDEYRRLAGVEPIAQAVTAEPDLQA